MLVLHIKLKVQLSADSEMSVKNGAELLDRLMKDIVAEAAPNYISIYPGNVNPNLPQPKSMESSESSKFQHNPSPIVSPSTSVDLKRQALQNHKPEVSPTRAGEGMDRQEYMEDKRAFNLARFIPLLAERVYVISPYTRMHLVSWIMVLDSIPDLELVAWLPDFLDGLL